jgi:arsenate reductase
MEKKRLLFVCVENSNRSQMAEAFARIYGGDALEAYSADSRPSGIVNSKAVVAMREIGYDLSKHVSESLDEVPHVEYDFVATMGCGGVRSFTQSNAPTGRFLTRKTSRRQNSTKCVT